MFKATLHDLTCQTQCLTDLSRLAFHFIDQNIIFLFIYVEARSSDTLLSNGVQNENSGTFNVNIQKNFAEIANILKDDGKTTSAVANQSSMKKVSEALSTLV